MSPLPRTQRSRPTSPILLAFRNYKQKNRHILLGAIKRLLGENRTTLMDGTRLQSPPMRSKSKETSLRGPATKCSGMLKAENE